MWFLQLRSCMKASRPRLVVGIAGAYINGNIYVMPVCRACDRWAAAAERRQRLDAELSELLSAAAGVEAMAAELQRDTAVMRRVRSPAVPCVGPSAPLLIYGFMRQWRHRGAMAVGLGFMGCAT